MIFNKERLAVLPQNRDLIEDTSLSVRAKMICFSTDLKLQLLENSRTGVKCYDVTLSQRLLVLIEDAALESNKVFLLKF